MTVTRKHYGQKRVRARVDPNWWTEVYIIFGVMNKSQEYFTNKKKERMGHEKTQLTGKEETSEKKQKNGPKVQLKKTLLPCCIYPRNC